jgi:hypothetical protein
MDLAEKVLYHQIHPAKLAADITGSVISTYLMWHLKFGPAMLSAWVPAILGSASEQHLQSKRLLRCIRIRPCSSWVAGPIGWAERWSRRSETRTIR